MDVKFNISEHAKNRFHERFAHINSHIEHLLKRSIIFGGQKGSEYLLLHEKCQIVFVISPRNYEHIVKTVLTLDQAKANLHQMCKIEFEQSDISEKIKRIRDEAQKEIGQEKIIKLKQKEIGQEKIITLKHRAKEYADKYGCFPDKTTRKEIFKQLRTELSVSTDDINEIFASEIGRIIREKHRNWGVMK